MILSEKTAPHKKVEITQKEMKNSQTKYFKFNALTLKSVTLQVSNLMHETINYMYILFRVSSIALFIVLTWRQMQLCNKNKNVYMHSKQKPETPWERMRSGSSIMRTFPQAQEKVS